MAQLSRPKRWAEAVAKGQQAQEALNEALQELVSVLDEAESADLPQGFGRD